MAVAVFATQTGMGIISPILPVYAQTLGASGVWIGFIAASYAISRAISLPRGESTALIGRSGNRTNWARPPDGSIAARRCRLARSSSALTSGNRRAAFSSATLGQWSDCRCRPGGSGRTPAARLHYPAPSSSSSDQPGRTARVGASTKHQHGHSPAPPPPRPNPDPRLL